METLNACTVIRSGETFAGRQVGPGIEAVIARTDPNEQESVVLLPHLDARLRERLSPA